MKCRSCGGGGGECGCGTGRCDHCQGTGVMADPPYGAPVLRHVLQQTDEAELARYWCGRARLGDCGQAKFVQLIAQRATGRALPAAAVHSFVAYWDDERRDDNLGEYIQRVAQYAIDGGQR